MDISNRIRQLCEQKNINSSYELAKLSKVPQSTISSIFSGSSPRTVTLEKICAGLGVTMAEFYTGEPSSLEEHELKKKYPRDFVKMIQQEDFTLNGELASPEDKERMIQIYYLMWQDSKEKNKKTRAEAKARKEQAE